MLNWEERFRGYGDREALVWQGESFTYRDMFERMGHLEHTPFLPLIPMALVADFSPPALAHIFDLIGHRAIIVPLRAGNTENTSLATIAADATHPLYDIIRKRNHPGLVLFTSGSTGQPKAAVHDLALLLKKFEKSRPPQRILNFLLFDHWGGLNTMFHTLANGGTLIVPESRRPADICALIERHQVEVLPASPSFLNLLLASGEHCRHDLSSLTTITYGTEPMPDSTLRRLYAAFPNVKLQQTYGLIELGVLRSQSESSSSPWVKIGGEGYQVRVVDGLLEIKAESAMLGYLNAPSPFTEDGWFRTGDAVEVKGEYFRILGRQSELINVGGEKVYPQEVEGVIAEMSAVEDVTVYGESHGLMGQIVCAKVRPISSTNPDTLPQAVKSWCAAHLAKYKIPVKVKLTTEDLHTDRMKKDRCTTPH